MVQDFIFRNCFVTAVTCSFNPRLLQITFPFVYPETKSPVGPENSNGWLEWPMICFLWQFWPIFVQGASLYRIHGTGIFSLQTSRLWRRRPLNWACTLRGDLRRCWVLCWGGDWTPQSSANDWKPRVLISKVGVSEFAKTSMLMKTCV